MLLMVTGVGGLIHIYATGYMHDDVRFQGDPSRYPRFFVYFGLFMAAMLLLVTGNSYLTMFVGWEGVGLCSYLLISFWYEKGKDGIGNALAGKKAFVVNRIGDFGFIIAMLITFWFFGTLTFEEVFHEAVFMGPAAATAATAITFFLFVGSAGKSAQIPLFVWLPDAMAGPTPVSALIHAATMVTAGIYMLVLEPGASSALDTSFAIKEDQLPERVVLGETDLVIKKKPAFARPVLHGEVLQRALAALVANWAIERMGGEQVFDNFVAPLYRLLARDPYLPTLADRDRAGGLEVGSKLNHRIASFVEKRFACCSIATRAPDLNQAHPAHADRLHLGVVAEYRNVCALPLGGVH